MTQEQPDCPINCPNRKPDRAGIYLFGRQIEPVEIALHFAVIILFLVPCARKSVNDDFTWQEALSWFGAMALASAIIRVAPTDRINAYLQLSGRPPVAK